MADLQRQSARTMAQLDGDYLVRIQDAKFLLDYQRLEAELQFKQMQTEHCDMLRQALHP